MCMYFDAVSQLGYECRLIVFVFCRPQVGGEGFADVDAERLYVLCCTSGHSGSCPVLKRCCYLYLIL